MEPGESLEDAVAREVFEEVGLRVHNIRYFGSQPWPFPASLMVGAYMEARSTAISLDHEELEDARWFSRAEIRTMLAGAHPDGLNVPARMSIASHLIHHFAESGE